MSSSRSIEALNSGLARGEVVQASATDLIVMVDGQRRPCDVLAITTGLIGRLIPQDSVLVWWERDEATRPVVIGRITPPTYAGPEAYRSDELVIEAGKRLTLKVGAGSITIREDGKILIKGKDLVSHAQRLNRIKGGAVQIN